VPGKNKIIAAKYISAVLSLYLSISFYLTVHLGFLFLCRETTLGTAAAAAAIRGQT
jgi:hypothetical protein